MHSPSTAGETEQVKYEVTLSHVSTVRSTVGGWRSVAEGVSPFEGVFPRNTEDVFKVQQIVQRKENIQ